MRYTITNKKEQKYLQIEYKTDLPVAFDDMEYRAYKAGMAIGKTRGFRRGFIIAGIGGLLAFSSLALLNDKDIKSKDIKIKELEAEKSRITTVQPRSRLVQTNNSTFVLRP